MNVSYNVREELSIDHTPGAGAIVIFGASGDLTKRKLLPAIYSLFKRGLLSPKIAVVGVARTAMSHDEFREQVKESILGDRELMQKNGRLLNAFPMYQDHIQKELRMKHCVKN